MSTRVGINGFGRMGRLALRAAWGWPELDVRPRQRAERRCRRRRPSARVRLRPRALVGAASRRGRDPLDRRTEPRLQPRRRARRRSLGRGRGRGRARVLRQVPHRGVARSPTSRQGVRKVVVAAPVKDEAALNVVVGVNDDRYEPDRHDVVTAASCTTNCLAPVVKVIHEGIGIRHGSITTLHDMTNTQTIVDAPHKDLRRARAASLSLIPTTTGSATAIGLIFPELRGAAERARGARAAAQRLAHRLRLRGRPADRRRGGQRPAARPRPQGPLAGILGYETRPLVSVDYQDDPRSGDRRRALDDGRRRDAGQGPRLVRQRVGLREPPGRARALVGADASAAARLRRRGAATCATTSSSPAPTGSTRSSTARPGCWSSSTSTNWATRRSRSPRCSSSTRSSASSPTSSAAGWRRASG